ncbi:Telomere repeat-binding factor 3 [Spatholobus suberectus]|nr:Telomere repeat-binding factor 3 [Spatholobus suberectus]
MILEKRKFLKMNVKSIVLLDIPLRFRKRETQCKPQASPVFLCNQLRRKKIPWTAEEEELIREGVQKFGFNDPKKWKKILAFGSHVFETVGKRRTPQDLKDKWKNMCKAHSKSK